MGKVSGKGREAGMTGGPSQRQREGPDPRRRTNRWGQLAGSCGCCFDDKL